MCFLTEDYNEWISKQYHKTDDDGDDEKMIPKRFYLPYCAECENFMQFVNKICSGQLLHRRLVKCNCCERDFRTLSDRQVRCSLCC